MSAQPSTALSDRQFALIEELAAAGAGAPEIGAAIAGSELFTPGEVQRLGGVLQPGNGSGSGGGSKGGGSKGGGSGSGSGSQGGNEWGIIGRLLPIIQRGDSSMQSQSGGLPYSPGTQVNPITSGGSSPIVIVAIVAVIGVGAFFLLRKKHKEPKK